MGLKSNARVLNWRKALPSTTTRVAQLKASTTRVARTLHHKSSTGGTLSSYTPVEKGCGSPCPSSTYNVIVTPGGTRTRNLWIRGPTPCPLGHEGMEINPCWSFAASSIRSPTPAHASHSLSRDYKRAALRDCVPAKAVSEGISHGHGCALNCAYAATRIRQFGRVV